MSYYNDKTVIYLNGSFVKATDANTDLYSQSLHYGYSAFEGIRAYKTHNGTRIFKAKAHFERLKRSCELAHIPFTWDIEQLIRETYKILSLNNLTDAYIRPLVFCGANMTLSAPKSVSIMICAWEWGAYLGHKQLKVGLSSYQRPNPKSIPIDAKISAHYVNSILATTEATKNGYDEAILLDMYNNVAEAPGANVFIEKSLADAKKSLKSKTKAAVRCCTETAGIHVPPQVGCIHVQLRNTGTQFLKALLPL